MTALSLHAPPQPSQLGRRQNAAQSSRTTAATAAMAASSPARNPGSFSRQTVLAMSHLQAQYAEASAPHTQQNGPIGAPAPGQPPSRPGQPAINGRRRTASPVSASRRPSSAPGDQQGGPSTQPTNGAHSEEDEVVVAKPPKPPLLRSKSEHGIRHDEAEFAEEEHYDWGARHGFEDHYQSEDIISQLANVSCWVIPSWCPGRLSAHEHAGRALIALRRNEKRMLTAPRIGTCILQTSGTKPRESRRSHALRYKIGGCVTALRRYPLQSPSA